ncbi:hypothetical protein ACH5RR_019517 [Cinchona calisaya]|uniref:Uncharacterized protein n=1 Tax=Cinchona calisaya TaxID=153742 RepID=A0ABD2ZQ33_9GENT
MSLLTENTSTPPVKLLGKRLFEEGSHQNPKNSPKFKRTNTDSVRTFPVHCGSPLLATGRSTQRKFKRTNTDSVRTFPMHCGSPCATVIQSTIPGSSGVKEMDEIFKAADVVAVAINAMPLRMVAPNAADGDDKVEVTREKLNMKNENFHLGKAPGKLDQDVLLSRTIDDLSNLKTSPQPLPVSSDHQNLKNPNSASSVIKIDWDALLSDTRDDLCILKTSPQPPLEHTNEYQNSRIPEKAPSQDYVSLSKVGDLANWKPNPERKTYMVKAENNEESAGDEDDDRIIIGEKSNNVFQGNLAKDSRHCVQGQTSKECDIKGEEDDKEVLILCASEWNNKLLQSGFRRQNKSEKYSEAEFSVEKIGKLSEIHFVEEIEAKDLKNMNIVPYDAATDIVSRNNVQKARSLYDELFKSLLQKYNEEMKGGKKSNGVYVKAAMLLKKEQQWVNVEPTFGHVPGVVIGDQFQYRAELALVGLHHELLAGINYATIEGKSFAISIVDSGRYENKLKSPNVLVYSGHGSNPKFKAQNLEDQKLEGGNLALKNSMDAKLPIRVIRKTMLAANATKKKMYIYDGLYVVSRFWPEKSDSDKMSFMFELVRVSGQPDCNHITLSKPRRPMENLDRGKAVATYDLSQGKEKKPIMVVNEVNNEKPAPFTYMTKLMHPHWYELSVNGGCNCTAGCSDFVDCPCSVKNNGELPFNEEGAIVKIKRMVYECGPNCKCPPCCQNRVSQHGPQFPLEVFRTKSTGWGVRSQVEIPSGSFICEYIGEVLQDKEADKKSNDEYLFDLGDGNGFTIDAEHYGNVGRFINHSCSPNLYAQNVLYNHDDKRLPHIMFFATKNIPALKELTYDYNYSRVSDANGNIKEKKCYCGSRKCSGRMY